MQMIGNLKTQITRVIEIEFEKMNVTEDGMKNREIWI